MRGRIFFFFLFSGGYVLGYKGEQQGFIYIKFFMYEWEWIWVKNIPLHIFRGRPGFHGMAKGIVYIYT